MIGNVFFDAKIIPGKMLTLGPDARRQITIRCGNLTRIPFGQSKSQGGKGGGRERGRARDLTDPKFLIGRNESV